MATQLIDTAILVDLLRGNTLAKSWLDGQPQGVAAISVVTVAELLAGCRNQGEQKAVEMELGLYPVLWLSESISQLAITWYGKYHLSHGVGFLDCLIGATASLNHLELCTLNEKHFRPLPQIQLLRPY